MSPLFCKKELSYILSDTDLSPLYKIGAIWDVLWLCYNGGGSCRPVLAKVLIALSTVNSD
jgi:hypothetical protein